MATTIGPDFNSRGCSGGSVLRFPRLPTQQSVGQKSITMPLRGAISVRLWCDLKSGQSLRWLNDWSTLTVLTRPEDVSWRATWPFHIHNTLIHVTSPWSRQTPFFHWISILSKWAAIARHATPPRYPLQGNRQSTRIIWSPWTTYSLFKILTLNSNVQDVEF